jgi:hypothetical protein
MQVSRQVVVKTAGVLCALLLAGFCSVPVYDLFCPWPTAIRALERYGHFSHFCVGISSEARAQSSADGRSFTSSQQRTFVLVRAPISWPLLVAVSQDHDGTVAVTDNALVFWLWLVLMVGLVWGTWYCLLGPFLKGRKERQVAHPALSEPALPPR